MRSRSLRLLLAVAVVFVAVGAIPAGAGAAAVYQYSVTLYGPNNFSGPAPYGDFSVSGLATGATTGIAVRHGASPAFFTTTLSSGNSSYNGSNIPGLVAGDTIEIRQPSAAVTPTESYVIPAPTITLTPGSGAVSGTAPAGQLLELQVDEACGSKPSQSVRIGKTTGSYAYTLKRPLIPGEWAKIALYSDLGDSLAYYNYAPGETPCFAVSAFPGFYSVPGAPPAPSPYELFLGGLSVSVAPDFKLVQVRGGSPVMTMPGSGSGLETNVALPGLPGDRYDLYRPLAAPTPVASFTIPQVTAIYDPSVDLVAVDAPAADHIAVYPCRQYTCPQENGRTARDRPAGRTILDFSKGTSEGPAMDIRSNDRVALEWTDSTGRFSYDVLATPGDLAGPSATVSLSKKLKISALIKALKKGYKLKLHSNEAGTAKLTFAMGKAKLATANGKLSAGSNTFKLKFTKSGKKAIRKLAAAGKHAKSKSATLTALLADASGNTTTITKTTKLKR